MRESVLDREVTRYSLFEGFQTAEKRIYRQMKGVSKITSEKDVGTEMLVDDSVMDLVGTEMSSRKGYAAGPRK